MSEKKKRVAFCTPFLERPLKPWVDSLEASIPMIEAAGWEHFLVQEQGNPYVSAARNYLTRRALDNSPDIIVYLDYDLSWRPQDLLTLIESKPDVCAGTYRFKTEEEKYMGTLLEDNQMRPVVNPVTGFIRSEFIPAGFLKVNMPAMAKIMRGYPDLLCGPPWRYSIDLFNHGAYKGVWYGEDYAFSRRWRDLGEELWLIPDLDITHWTMKISETGERIYTPYPGNFHRFLLRQPGGSECPLRPLAA